MSPRPSTRLSPIVALLTDFGTADHYVAAMKAVLLAHDRRIRIIDISHHIEPGNVRSGSYTLWAVHRTLPVGTVCIAVVDPGVGTDREILCATVDARTYLAPDNGVLDAVLADCTKAGIVRVSHKKVRSYLPDTVSTTFHGRDIFAPLGARLAAGTDPGSLGTRKAFVRPASWRVSGPGDTVSPAIMSVDAFGNIITNIAAQDLPTVQRSIRAISVGKVMISVAASTFGTAPDNTPCLVPGSSGLVEIIVRNGSAAAILRVTDRTAIRVVWAEGQE